MTFTIHLSFMSAASGRRQTRTYKGKGAKSRAYNAFITLARQSAEKRSFVVLRASNRSTNVAVAFLGDMTFN